MKKVKLLMTGFALAFIMMSGQAQEIKWQHIVDGQEDWDKLLKNAKGKTIFVDVYTDWCGYCKMMDRDVFSTTDVSKYFNKNYINIKIDGETTFGREFVAKYEIKGFPYYMYMNDQSYVLNTISGYVDEEQLMSECVKADSKSNEYKKYSKVKSIDKVDKSEKPGYLVYLHSVDADKAQKIANELMGTLTENEFLSTDYTDFFLTFSTNYDNELIEFISDYNNKISFGTKHGVEVLQTNIEKTVEKYFMIATDTKDKQLMDKVASKLIPCLVSNEEEAVKMKFAVDKAYYAGTKNAEKYYETVLAYEKANEVESNFWLVEAEEAINDRTLQPGILKAGNKFLDKSIEQKKTCMAYIMKSYIYYLLEDTDNSEANLNESLKQSPTEEETQTINELKQLIEAGKN